MDDASKSNLTLAAWKEGQVSATLAQVQRWRWGLAFMVIGWVHLGCFLLLQGFYDRGMRNPPPYLAVWGVELLINLWVLRRFSGPRWSCATPLIHLFGRIWGTFLLLSFTLVSLNHLMSFSMEWYRAAWTTMSTYGFAMMAYLFSPWFFVPAVQMYFTGLLLATFPQIGFMAYGISWCVALNGIGLTLEWKRAKDRARVAGPTPSRRPASFSANVETMPSRAVGLR